ncbi:MAG: hypothetical protein H0V25_04090 [Solirubrobacterales bacterium]|nr:hypothetical protein [Solirubrobacterales bacterium]
MPTARSILADDLWCVLEVCADPATQRWSPALILCTDDEDRVAAELARWVTDVPQFDVRLSGYTRDTLSRAADAPEALCHLADLTGVGPS